MKRMIEIAVCLILVFAARNTSAQQTDERLTRHETTRAAKLDVAHNYDFMWFGRGKTWMIMGYHVSFLKIGPIRTGGAGLGFGGVFPEKLYGMKWKKAETGLILMFSPVSYSPRHDGFIHINAAPYYSRATKSFGLLFGFSGKINR